jgi:hypothetical protein
MKTLDELRHLRENLAKQDDNKDPWHHQVWKTLMALLDEAIDEREARLRGLQSEPRTHNLEI